MWSPQPGPQLDAIQATWCYSLFFGGARGGGKSDFLLGDYLQDISTYGQHWKGIIFRQSYNELEELLARAKQLYPPTGGQWVAGKKWWYWPRYGCTLKMRYLEIDADADQYQGHQYAWAAGDEITNWASSDGLDKIQACVRNGDMPIPTKRWRCSGNPGGKGHAWVKARYVDPAPTGYMPIYDERSKTERMFIPSKVQDNRILLANDPGYIDRLHLAGSPDLVRCWLDGDWDITLGAYFPEFRTRLHVVQPFEIPAHWLKFQSFDWGSASPFSADWWAVSDGEDPRFPRGALICYRQWYGASEPNKGLKLKNEEIAAGILEREQQGEKITYRVADPSIWQSDGGPSIFEQFARGKVVYQKGDNKRIAGWSQLRSRLIGIDGRPMIFWFSTCADTIRTLPAAQHDKHNAEDLDTDSEDHALDSCRYSCMSRPWTIGTPQQPQVKFIQDMTFGELNRMANQADQSRYRPPERRHGPAGLR